MRSLNVSIDQGSNVLQFETAPEMRHEDVVSRNKWERTSRAMERGLALESEEFHSYPASGRCLHNVGITTSWNEMDLNTDCLGRPSCYGLLALTPLKR